MQRANQTKVKYMSIVPIHFDLLSCEGIKNKVDMKIFFSVIQRQQITMVYKPEMAGGHCLEV